MERLIINVPESKSVLVKQILKALGVIIQQEKKTTSSAYRKKLTKVGVWSNDDVSIFEETRKAFDDLKQQQW